MMSRVYARVLLCLSAFTAAGCSSGEAVFDDASDDGQVIVFHDSSWRTAYMADARGVRAFDAPKDSHFAITPDGKHIICFPSNHEMRGVLAKGSIRVVEVSSGRNWQTSVPEIPMNPRGLYRTKVFVDNSPSITIRRQLLYPSTQPAEILSRQWRPGGTWVAAEPPADAREIAFICAAGSSGGQNSNVEKPYVFEMRYDGWNARRTVWVRPDGSTIELLRQNDLPLALPLPVAVYLVQMPVFGIIPPYCLMYWPAGVSALISPFNAEPGKEDYRKLQELVALRRAAATQPASQPVTRPASKTGG